LQDFLESIIKASSVTTAFGHGAVPDVPFQAFELLLYLLVFEQLGGDAVGDRGGLSGLQIPQFRRGLLRHRLVQWTAGHAPMRPTTTPVAPRAVQSNRPERGSERDRSRILLSCGAHLEERIALTLLRGTTNECLVYSLKPEETRDRTTEGMELILKARMMRCARSSGNQR
jgi:hypothetical protein